MPLAVAELVQPPVEECLELLTLPATPNQHPQSLDERRASNVRGVCGKTPLNSLNVQAIFQTSLCHFLLKHLEIKTVPEKDMQNAVDEVCRKTKTVAATETENIY